MNIGGYLPRRSRGKYSPIFTEHEANKTIYKNKPYITRRPYIGVGAPSNLGRGAGDDFLARTKIRNRPESARIEIGMQTQTFTIFASNEAAIIEKIVKLKACILNSINSLNVI